MIKSMTAFGRAFRATPFGRLVIELHSVNRRGLDIGITCPKDLLRFDIDMRKWLGEKIQRGQLTVKVHLQLESVFSVFSDTSLAMLKELKQAWEKIALSLGWDPEKMVDLSFLVQQLKELSSQEMVAEEPQMREVLKETFDEALKEFMIMKEKEGLQLKNDIAARLKIVEEEVRKIQHHVGGAVKKFQEKLEQKIREVWSGSDSPDERVLREIALYAQKVDITEELIRLKSHFIQFHELLENEEKSNGRTMDFLIQEIQREVNTLAAKASDDEVSRHVVEIKSGLEKMREQVQNIE